MLPLMQAGRDVARRAREYAIRYLVYGNVMAVAQQRRG
jgi:hypothetical protein